MTLLDHHGCRCRIVYRGSEVFISETQVTIDADLADRVLHKLTADGEQLNLFILSPKRRVVHCFQRNLILADSEPPLMFSYNWEQHGPFPLGKDTFAKSENLAEEGLP